MTDPTGAGAPPVRLVPMTWDDFDRWSQQSVAGFAADQVAAGVLAEPEATAYAQGALADLLPDGLVTPLHHLFTVRDPADRSLGSLWLRVRPLSTEVEAFVLDVELAPEVRGRGLGRATMVAAEEAARALGASVLRLNVFGHNTTAQRLYASRGLRVVRTALAREAGSGPGAAARTGPRVGLLRRASEAELEGLPRAVEGEQADRQHRADVLPRAEAEAQAFAVAAEWAAALRSGAALVAEEDRHAVALVRLEDGTTGLRARLHLLGAPGDEATAATTGVLDRVADAALARGAEVVEVTLHGPEPVGLQGYRVTAQTMVKRW